MILQYSPGMRIEARDEQWLVKKVDTNTYGKRVLQAIGLSPLVKDKEVILLDDLEKIIIVNPVETKLVIDDSPFFNKSRLFIESQWRQKKKTDERLYIGHNAAMNLMKFQLEPARIALEQPRQRILIADAVGLGKTLEAGILMSELIARGKGRRILVVTVKSMMTQFQKEMWNRFTIPLIRLDSAKIQKIRSRIPTNYNPFYFYDKTIISMDTLKRDIEYRTHLESAWWDIIVIDEAHNVAERGKNRAQRSRLAALLSERSDTLIMLSATPHDGRAESFASLMNMLDPTAIANPSDYTREDIRGMCVRRFKKDIQDQAAGAFQQRKISIEECHASLKEEQVFDYFTEMKLHNLSRNDHTEQLFKTTLEKSLFSSPAACIRSVEERLKKLRRTSNSEAPRDITALEGFLDELRQIKPDQFSRYIKLLELLKSPAYGWKRDDTKDRIVIFTERIETMRYVAKTLRADLQLPAEAVQELYGGMSDMEQQRIVEEFGRDESPIRVLVASDVASEGINLHYLCHRLIHFDIPWSLMVFQQRNGRIDRYGQTQPPDIRYLKTNSQNPKIKGDMRILEILIEKEEQAYKNIGDPAMLMKAYDAEEEEKITAHAIETGIDAEDFDKKLSIEEAAFDPLALLLAGEKSGSSHNNVQATASERTLFEDMDYLDSALKWFTREERININNLQTVQGVEIELNEEVTRRLKGILPPEAIPENNLLRLSPDKDFCMKEMQHSLQNAITENAWPSTQYLWPMHPIFDWINDKASILFGRQEAPVIGIPSTLQKGECIFLMAGTIPNRKATPMVDEWFGIQFINGHFAGLMTMEEVLAKTKIDQHDIPNHNLADQKTIDDFKRLLPVAVQQANQFMLQNLKAFRDKMNPKINEELAKLSSLKDKHRKYIQLSLFEQERRKEQEMRRVDEIFTYFNNWVRDTMELEDKAYIRVIAVIVGV